MKCYLILITFALCAASLNAATIHVPADQPIQRAGNDVPPIEWEQHYGDSLVRDYGEALVQTADTHFVFLGHFDFFAGMDNILIVKADRNGETLWTKTYGDSSGEYIGYDIANTVDGGFIVCGATTAEGAGSWDIYILKLDPLGDTVWTKTFGGTYQDLGQSIVQTLDGGYCYTGSSQSAPYVGENSAYISKIDSLGNHEWTTYIGEPHGSAEGRGLVQTYDSSFYLVGGMDTTDAIGLEILNVLIAKIDYDGSLLWQKLYGSPEWVGSGKGLSICQTYDGAFAVSGYQWVSAGQTLMLVMKVDGTGAELWSHVYGDTVSVLATSIVETVNGEFIMGGYSFPEWDIYLLKLDDSGAVQWQLTIDSGEEEELREVIETFDGGYLFVGKHGVWADKTLDMYAVKLATVLPNVESITTDGVVQNAHVVNHTPEFAWSIISPTKVTQDSILLEVGEDTLWDIAEMWSTGTLSYTDSTILYSGNPLIDGDSYYLRFRVAQSYLWSPWYETSFRMNSPPTAPTALHPTGGEYADDLPILWVLNSTDAEGDPLTYDFSGFHDTDCVAPIIDLTGVPQTPDSTGGQIIEPLGESCIYWWSARAFDGYEYSEGSPTETFVVNATPEPPSAPEGIYPPDTSGLPVFDMLPEFQWSPSYDPDPLDTVRYKLEIAIDSAFNFVYTVDSIVSTIFTLTDSLQFATHYWWRVTAFDNTGLSAMSPNTPDFWTWTLGDLDYSHDVNIADLVFLVDYLFRGAFPPYPLFIGDVNGDCQVNIADLTYLVDYLFRGGSAPKVGCAGA